MLSNWYSHGSNGTAQPTSLRISPEGCRRCALKVGSDSMPPRLRWLLSCPEPAGSSDREEACPVVRPTGLSTSPPSYAGSLGSACAIQWSASAHLHSINNCGRGLYLCQLADFRLCASQTTGSSVDLQAYPEGGSPAQANAGNRRGTRSRTHELLRHPLLNAEVVQVGLHGNQQTIDVTSSHLGSLGYAS
jgi:hypothetical protein